MACDPLTMPDDADCFDCIPPGMQAAVQSYLLARIRGGSMDVNEIVRDAACLTSCIPPGLLPRIRSYLLCQLSNTGGGVIPEPPECDADAQAFITAAGLTDETQIGAVCVLVRDLKTYPAVGTKYWDRDILIYPFVGGNATSHAVNLKTPGTYNVQFLGATPPIHSANGVQGRLATCWANTQYVVQAGQQNNIRIMWYLDLVGTPGHTALFGCGSPAYVWNWMDAGLRFNYHLNDGIPDTLAGTKPLGTYFIQRQLAASKEKAYGTTAWSINARASTGVPNRYLFIFSGCDGGAVPNGNPVNPNDARLSSFTLGSPLTTNAEKDEYKGIWDAFNNTLGRGHP